LWRGRSGSRGLGCRRRSGRWLCRRRGRGGRFRRSRCRSGAWRSGGRSSRRQRTLSRSLRRGGGSGRRRLGLNGSRRGSLCRRRNRRFRRNRRGRRGRRGRSSRLQASRSGSGFLRGFFGCGRCFSCGILFGLSLNRAAHVFGDVDRDGARVGLFFRDAEAGQKVNDGLGLDFELAGQLVDSDLIGVGHALRSIHPY